MSRIEAEGYGGLVMVGYVKAADLQQWRLTSEDDRLGSSFRIDATVTPTSPLKVLDLYPQVDRSVHLYVRHARWMWPRAQVRRLTPTTITLHVEGLQQTGLRS